MGRFLARRLVLSVPVLLGVATLVFSLIHLIPGDPAQAMLGEAASPADVDALRAKLGLDRPLLEQYGAFLGGLVRGDLGTSLRTGEPVARQIWLRVPATVELAAAAMVVAIGLAMPLGVLAAVRRGTVVDFASMALALTGISVPNFWLGAAAGDRVRRVAAVAAGVGSRHVGASGPARHLARRRPGGHPGAHDARDAARGAARALRAGRARSRGLARRGPCCATPCATASSPS